MCLYHGVPEELFSLIPTTSNQINKKARAFGTFAKFLLAARWPYLCAFYKKVRGSTLAGMACHILPYKN